MRVADHCHRLLYGKRTLFSLNGEVGEDVRVGGRGLTRPIMGRKANGSAASLLKQRWTFVGKYGLIRSYVPAGLGSRDPTTPWPVLPSCTVVTTTTTVARMTRGSYRLPIGTARPVMESSLAQNGRVPPKMLSPLLWRFGGQKKLFEK